MARGINITPCKMYVNRVAGLVTETDMRHCAKDSRALVHIPSPLIPQFSPISVVYLWIVMY